MSYKSDILKADRTNASDYFPKVVLIDNTSACNLRCSMCDHPNIRKYRKIQTMSMELYKRIIDEISIEDPTVRVWEIFFGDPFMCKDMPKRIEYAKNKGLTDVVLNTNGVLMAPDKSRAYIETGLDAIYVGIDAATEETYNKIRVGGDFKKTVDNILAYRDLLVSHGRPEQKLFVQFVVSEYNEDETDAFKSFWTMNGVNTKIRPKVSWAGLVEANNLQSNDAVLRRPCYWLMQTANICADGRVPMCSVDLHCRVPSGDMTKNSLKEIWQEGILAEYRKAQAESRFEDLPTMCRNCADWQSAYSDYVLV